MFSLDHYSDFPQQQIFFANLHNSSPCTSFGDERINPFHHQIYLPNQMGIFLPQTLHQDPNIDITPTNNDHKSTSTIFPYNPSAPYEIPTCNQGSLGLLSSPKKDRHTKISTAHGFRDRRVRLSMAIAREFFDLQDMLGFDKASMTIGWLLANSKNAIQELALAKHSSGLYRSNSNSSSSPHEEAFTTRRTRTRKRSNTLASANYSKEEIENQAKSFVARENRAKARARARERTREKLSTLTNPTQFDDLGFQTSGKTGCFSHFLTDFKARDFSRSPHLIEQDRFGAPLQNVSGLNVIRSRHSSPSINLQNLLGDQDASIRVNHLPDLPFGGNYNPEASATMFSSFSGWNILTFPTELMHMTDKLWDNQVQQQRPS